MKKFIQPETYWRLSACLGVWFLSCAGFLTAAPLTLPIDTCLAPGPPILKSNVSAVCRGDLVELLATGCAGTVVWSTGETGDRIAVRPLRTVRYTAICRSAGGCVSCFADPLKLIVKTPGTPIVTSSSPIICAGESVTLTAAHCTGTIRWPDASTGPAWVVVPRESSVYQATSEVEGCVGNPSAPVQVQVGVPAVPILFATKTTACFGQSVQLTASGCVGRIRWSDGGEGLTRQVNVVRTTDFRAVCQVGHCRSDSSTALRIVMTSPASAPALVTSVSNGCPYQTADLTKAITESKANAQAWYEFKTKPSPDAPPVQTATAVLGGTYYVFERNASGCYSAPVAVLATITPCENAIAACLSNPAAASLKLDTLDSVKGLARLRGQLYGSATSGYWQTTGTGLLTDTTTMLARYVASETDLQRGFVVVTMTTNDPDGKGPCIASSASLTVSVLPTVEGENGKPVAEPIPIAVTPNGPQSGTSASAETTLVFIPEGFSPNNDGVNDRFVIQQTGQALTVSLEVFNRWGQLVYQSDPYKNDWDGTANRGIRVGTTGQGLPDGTYYYAVRLSDGREFARFLTLAR